CEELVEYRLASSSEPVGAQAERVALAAWRALGWRAGRRVDLPSHAAEKPLFPEANPLAGLHPEHSGLPIPSTKAGLPYRELIARIVASAAPRVAVTAPAARPMRLVRGGRARRR